MEGLVRKRGGVREGGKPTRKMWRERLKTKLYQPRRELYKKALSSPLDPGRDAQDATKSEGGVGC